VKPEVSLEAFVAISMAVFAVVSPRWCLRGGVPGGVPGQVLGKSTGKVQADLSMAV
jgi:hypothetical protein